MSALAIKNLDVRCHKLATAHDGLRIAHVSDLHLERWTPLLCQLRSALRELAYDVLLFSGDFCQWPQDAEMCADLFARLLEGVHPPLGIYGVLGNHDAPAFAQIDTPARMLRNESVRLTVAEKELVLTGVEQHVGRRGTVRDALDQLDDDAMHLFMAHYPSTAYELPAGQGAFVLAGHTHGGQIRIPGIGCIFANDDIPRGMSRGLHTVRGNWLHVSAGVGASWLIRARIFCPPEISLLTLRTTQPRRVRRRRRSSGHQPTGQRQGDRQPRDSGSKSPAISGGDSFEV